MRPFFSLALLTLIAGCGAAHTPATAAKTWSARARNDILAAYAAFAENHPGMHDPANASFPAQLAAARDAALKVNAVDRTGYVEALGVFTAGLEDGHAQLAARGDEASPTESWPGFVVAWRGEALFVHEAGAASPAPAGARITACNGIPIADFLVQQLRTQSFRPKEPGQWWHRAPRAFVASNETGPIRAEHCVFDGREARLAWLAAPADLGTRIRRATDGERTPIGLSEPRPKIFLVGLPDFQPDAPSVDRYHALFTELRARHDEIAGARAVVIDLRYNNGGSSSWSRQTAEALWGDEATKTRAAKASEQVRVWWRASRGNTAYVVGLESSLRAQGNAHDADDIRVIGAGMQEALARGAPFYVEESDALPSAAVASTDLRAPVYVITPGRCGSACLDAIDTFSRFPSTKRIGAPTSADSTYMDVRVLDLPSGDAQAVVPTKVFVNRPRGSGEAYRPAIEVDDLDWSTMTFLDRIERDLERRPRK